MFNCYLVRSGQCYLLIEVFNKYLMPSLAVVVEIHTCIYICMQYAVCIDAYNYFYTWQSLDCEQRCSTVFLLKHL